MKKIAKSLKYYVDGLLNHGLILFHELYFDADASNIFGPIVYP